MAHDTESNAPSDEGEVTGADRYRQRLTQRPVDTPETEIWQGTYSPRAMIDTWVGCGIVSVIAIVVAALYLPEPRWWMAVVGGLILVWVLPFLALVYRRMSIAYRLTSHRLFHESGILKRAVDRIELIRINDVSFEQRLFERLVTGTGTIKIESSDTSTPVLIMPGIDDVRTVFSKIDQAFRSEKQKYGVQVNTV